MRDALLIALGARCRSRITPAAVRAHNQFHWAPIVEVAKLFAAIFVTIIPGARDAGAGRDGALRWICRSSWRDGDGRAATTTMVFWLTGLLSAFLDNAPTYLVFFNLAGGDAQALMGAHARDARGAVDGRRLLRRAHLHRQRAELHDQGDRRGPRRGDAELLRVSSARRRSLMLPLLAVVAAVWL